MKKQFAVIGMGRFGTSIASALYEAGFEVIAIDKDEDRIDECMDFVTHAVVIDSTDEGTLKEAGIRNMDVVIVAIGDDIQSSILTVLVLKDLGIKHIIAKAVNERHGMVLTKVGADRVVYPEKETGFRIARNLISPNVLDFIELEEDYTIEEILAPDFMIDKTLNELDIRAKYNINVIAIHNGGKMNITPLPNDIIQKNDVLVVIGQKVDLHKLEKQAVLV